MQVAAERFSPPLEKKDSGYSLSFMVEKARWNGPVATNNEAVSHPPSY